jgi:hypothetical protein
LNQGVLCEMVGLELIMRKYFAWRNRVMTNLEGGSGKICLMVVFLAMLRTGEAQVFTNVDSGYGALPTVLPLRRILTGTARWTC